jgi:WYL domain
MNRADRAEGADAGVQRRVDPLGLVVKGASAPDDEGWCDTELAVESPAVAVSQHMALGTHVEVCAPAEARGAMAAPGRAIADRHSIRGAEPDRS